MNSWLNTWQLSTIVPRAGVAYLTLNTLRLARSPMLAAGGETAGRRVRGCEGEGEEVASEVAAGVVEDRRQAAAGGDIRLGARR